MSIRVLIADDEPFARHRLRRFLADEADVEVVAEVDDGADAAAALRARDVDVAILDVNLPTMSGLDVAAGAGDGAVPVIIFATAYDEHAVRAFELHTLDYLLKPVAEQRFRAAFARARSHLVTAASAERGRRLRAALREVAAACPGALPDAGAADVRSRPIERFTVRAGGRAVFVRAQDVDWLEAEGNYVRVHAGRASHLVRGTIAALDGALDHRRFVRIHRGVIVNLDRVAELRPGASGDGTVLLHDGTTLRLSRTYRDRVEAEVR